MEHALRTYRSANDVTLDELSGRSGVNKSLLSKIERGVVAQPKISTMRKIIEATGGALSMRDFLPSEETAA